MRTTLTLDDDVAVMLEQARVKSAGNFKQLVNDLLRAGLQQALEPKVPAVPYRTPSSDAGKCLIGSIADIEHVLTELEGPMRR